MNALRWLLPLAGILLGHPALAQTPACASGTNSPACQEAAKNFQPTDILLGQQTVGPSRPNQTVRVTPLQLNGARTCPLPLGPGIDDAPNLKACLMNGNQTAIIPPANYVIASLIPATATLGVQAFRFSNLQNVTVLAYGATFTIAPALQAAPWAFVGYNDNSKNITWRGGTFTGSDNRPVGSALNNGMCWENVTNLTVADVTFNGAFYNGSAICGVYGFEVTLDNINAYGVAIGTDNAWGENMLVMNSKFWGAGAQSVGMANFSDPMTHGVLNVTNPDGTPRTLKTGLANNLQYINNTVVAFHTGLRLDGVNGALVIGNMLRDGLFNTTANTGVLLDTTDLTNSLGFVTQNIIITKNTMTNNGQPGATANGGGVLFATNNHGLKNITIEGNAIYDNCGWGVGNAPGITGVGQINLRGNDFNTRGGSCAQAVGVFPALVASMGPLMRMDGNTGNGTDVQNIPVANGYSGVSLAGGHPKLIFQQDNKLVLYTTGASGADRPIFQVPMDSDIGQVDFMTAGIVVSNASSINIALEGAPGTSKGMTFYSATSPRWDMISDGTAESGSDAGSDFVLRRYSDTGAVLGTPFVIQRATGAMTLNASGLTLGGIPTTCTGNSGKVAALSGVLNICP